MNWLRAAVYVGAGLLVLGGVLAVPAMIPRRAFWRRASRFSAIAGAFVGLSAAIGTWLRMGRPPAASDWEMFLLLAPAMALAYVVAEGLAKSREAGLPVLLAAAWLMWAGHAGTPHAAIAEPLPLPLRSGWLPVYLVANALAYGFLFTAGVQAVVLLLVREMWPRRAERAGRAVYWSVCLGFPFLLWATMVGGAWSQGVRGVPWSWTSRELWVLAYCLLLAAYLNVHFIAGWRERRAAWFLIVASLVGLCSFSSLRRMPAPAGDMSARPVSRPRPVARPAGPTERYNSRHKKG